MRYKTRRKLERKARAEKTTHRMSEPVPIAPLRAEDQQPERVPIRTGPGTIKHFRVTQLEADLSRWAQELDLSVAELQKVIAARRYRPEPPPVAKEPRSPAWYISDNFSGQYLSL